MSQTASLFRCLGKTVRDPARLMSILNREICATVSRGMFVTMISGLYDPATGRLRFANAGHMPPLLRRPNQRSVEMPADSPPLGIVPNSKYETEEVNLDGGQFVLCTDGVTEFRFGDEELGTRGPRPAARTPRAASRCCSASTPWSRSCSAPAGARATT